MLMHKQISNILMAVETAFWFKKQYQTLCNQLTTKVSFQNMILPNYDYKIQ